MMSLLDVSNASLSSLLHTVGGSTTVSDLGSGLSVSIEMLDAIRERLQPWELSRDEAAVMAVIWRTEHQPDADPYDRTVQIGLTILAQTFGEVHAFDYNHILRGLEKRGVIEAVSLVTLPGAVARPKETTNMLLCYRHTFVMTSAFQTLVEILNTGVAFASLNPRENSIAEIARGVELDDSGKARVAEELEGLPAARAKANTNATARISSHYLRELTTTNGLEGLILNADVEQQVHTIVNAIRNNGRNLLVEWGIVESPVAKEGKAILLHGPAGTGKTSGARAIAAALDARLVTTGIEKILGRYMGDNEQNLAKILKEFRSLATTSSQRFVLLIDECEFLFGRRFEASHRSDESHNNLVGMMLKEMETLPGIIIGTTNLVENLDPAFSRRFDYRVKIDLPDKAAQRRLWAHYLKPTIPGAEAIDLDALIRIGDFTGAIIERVIHNTCTRIVNDHTREQRLFTEDLVAACRQEQRSSFDYVNKAFMGFG